MEILEPFDVVVVPFPFTDRQTAKRRPALILSTRGFQKDSGSVILARITSATHSSWNSDSRLEDWEASGLPHPAVVRAKIFTLDQRFVLRCLGCLSHSDARNGRISLSGILGMGQI